MITFKPVAPYRKKDGTTPVYIRVTFRGEVRRLSTTMVCYPDGLTRTGKIKDPDVLRHAEDLIRRMRAAVADLSPYALEGKDVGWVVARIKEGIEGETFRLDFFEWAEQVIARKVAPATRNSYKTTLATLERFLGKRELDVNDITRAMLLEFADFVEGEPKQTWLHASGQFVSSGRHKRPGVTMARHMMKLAHIFNAAKIRYNDEDTGRILIPRSPFSNLPKVEVAPPEGQRNLGADLMQRVISARSEIPQMQWALDLFVISFGLMGVNVADLYSARTFSGEVWEYNRKKTERRRADRAYMRVTVPEVIRGRIGRAGGKSGAFWLQGFRDGASDKDHVTRKANYWLRKWAESEGVEPFTMGAARHTWASLARKAGIEKALVDEGLAHVGDFTVTDIYAERDWDRINEANARLLAKFQW